VHELPQELLMTFLLLATAATDSFENTVLFMMELVTMLLDYMRTANDRDTKVVDFKQPQELRKLLDRCLQIHSEPQNLEQILNDCQETMKYCVKTG